MVSYNGDNIYPLYGSTFSKEVKKGSVCDFRANDDLIIASLSKSHTEPFILLFILIFRGFCYDYSTF